jgi:hypothetical protein
MLNSFMNCLTNENMKVCVFCACDLSSQDTTPITTLLLLHLFSYLLVQLVQLHVDLTANIRTGKISTLALRPYIQYLQLVVCKE